SCSLACGTVAQACCVYGLKLSKRSPVEASTQRPSTYIWQVFVMVAPSRSGRSVRAQIDYTCIRTYTYPCTHGDGPVAGRYRRRRRHPSGVAQSRLSTGGRIMDRIAVIGLGQMGGAIATRLHSQGLGIVGFDSNEAACREFAARGASVAGSVAEAASQSDVVLTSLPNSAAVQAVWTGADGLVTSVRPGTLCVELSSIDPQTMQAVGSSLVARGAEVVDCPVSGSPQ